jgi:hypothetical protein
MMEHATARHTATKEHEGEGGTGGVEEDVVAGGRSGSRGALPLSPATTPRWLPLGADLVLGVPDPGGGTPDLSTAIGHRPPPLRLVPSCEPGGAGEGMAARRRSSCHLPRG